MQTPNSDAASRRGLGDWLSRLICFLEGPYGTAFCVLLALGYPHGHPMLRGVLVFPALLWLVVGWVMTYFSIVDPWPEAGRA